MKNKNLNFSYSVENSLIYVQLSTLACAACGYTRKFFSATCCSQRNATQQIEESMARQLAEYMLHAATYLATLRKVEAYSTFPVTRKAFFRCRTYCKERGLHVQFCLQLV